METFAMKLSTLALLLCFLLAPNPCSGMLPFGDLVKDTIGAVRGIKQNIQNRIKSRERPPNPVEVVQDVKEALIEDYVQNSGKRIRKMCQYLKQGQLYQGPCPQDQQGNNGGGNANNGGGYGNNGGGYETSETRQYEQPNTGYDSGKYRQGGRRGGGPSQKVVVVEEETRVVPDGQPGYGRPPGRHRGGKPNRDKVVIVEEHVVKPPRHHGRGRHRNKPEIIIVEEDHKVPPETVAAEEGDDEEKPIPRVPPINRNNPKSARQQQQGGSLPCQTTDGFAGVCMPPSFCYSQYSSIEDYRENICQFVPGGASGICCPTNGGSRVVDHFELTIRVPQANKPTVKIGFISLENINTAATEAQKFIQDYIERERQLVQNGMVQRRGSMQSLHQAFFGEFDPVQFKLTKGGFINLITTIIIKNKFKLNNEEARDGLYKYSIEHTDLEQFCIKEPDCIQQKYRTMDGSCNNLQRPLWGKSNTAFERVLPPAYDDGLNEPRTKSIDGSLLPSARLVSFESAKHRNIPDPKYTLMLMQWGQFIDHDLTLAASTRAATGQGLICCHPRTQQKIEHHACFPIDIPREDPFYSRHGQRCMHLVRNSPSPRSGCALGHREQMNTLTHVLDASMVYGSNLERSKELRTFRDGKLRFSSIHDTQFLPFDRNNRSDECGIPAREQREFKCFLGGDVRVNEQTGLTMLHNLLLREHNRVAGELKKINPRWNDEILFQEARRIIAAEVQHITYNEWLPIILGPTVMKHFNILPKSFGFTKDYNPRINPNILNEFATAAYRFHSLIQGTFVLLDNNGQETRRFDLHTLFNNPKSFYIPNAFDEYLNGFTNQPAQSMDKFFTEEITNRLFQEENSQFGMDLVALNIQRGRDHGLPGYNSYRRACGMQPVRSFQELDQFMQAGSAQVMSQLYRNVEDIDLFIGGCHERPLPEAILGPTFACIVAEQARRSKHGDRFWYENGGLPHSFSQNQLNEIRKSSLAALICNNADTIQLIQPLGFLRPGGWNNKVPCEQIVRMNLEYWRNEKLWN